MKTIRPNQFLNPADCEFEVLGFFEEFIRTDYDYPHVLGYRILDVDEAPRTLGAGGRLELTLTAPVTLRRFNHRKQEVIIKASPAEPVKVTTMVQILCGRLKDSSKPAALVNFPSPKTTNKNQ